MNVDAAGRSAALVPSSHVTLPSHIITHLGHVVGVAVVGGDNESPLELVHNLQQLLQGGGGPGGLRGLRRGVEGADWRAGLGLSHFECPFPPSSSWAAINQKAQPRYRPHGTAGLRGGGGGVRALTQASTRAQQLLVASRSPVWPTISGLAKLMRTWSYLPAGVGVRVVRGVRVSFKGGGGGGEHSQSICGDVHPHLSARPPCRPRRSRAPSCRAPR